MSQYPPPSVPPPGMGQPIGQPMRQAPSNGMGTAALILGVLQFLCLGLIGAILAIIFGKIGMNKANRGEATNGGVAKAGFILGVIGTILWLVIIGAAIWFVNNAPSVLCRLPAQVGTNVTLTGCSIPGESFAGRTLTNLTVSNTDLSGSNFSRVTLSNSTFTNSDLSNTNFTTCGLTNVRFTGTNLVGANFRNCTFRGVKINNSVYDSTTVWPKGFAPDDDSA